MTTELFVRLAASFLIVALYASNFVSGWLVTQRARKNLPPVRDRWKAGAWLGRSLIKPWSVHGALTDYDRDALSRTIDCYGTYLSSFTAAGMTLTHVAWLEAGAWVAQDHLFAFASFHYLAAIFVHAIHARVAARHDHRNDIK